MPKLPVKIPERTPTYTRRNIIASEPYANSLARIFAKSAGLSTSELYRLGRIITEYFEQNPEAKNEFVKWYEAL